MDKSYSDINREGLWSNNVALVQVLGLCPLLAATATTLNGLGLGIATTLTLVLSSLIVSLIRNSVKPEVRIPIFVLVIASFVTAVELLMQAFLYDLYLVLGIFIPLIVTNCVIIARAESFASKNNVWRSLLDGLAMGIGFTAVLLLLGGIREILGHGTLLAQAELMFGEGTEWLTITLIDDYRGFLLAILPPGAFLGLGLLIAIKNVIDKRLSQRSSQIIPAPIQTEAANS